MGYGGIRRGAVDVDEGAGLDQDPERSVAGDPDQVDGGTWGRNARLSWPTADSANILG